MAGCATDLATLSSAKRRPTTVPQERFSPREAVMGAETDHQVFRAMQTVQFEHKCADAVPHQVQAYAELGSEDGHARALVLLYARRDAVRRGEVFVGARLVAMRLETGRENGGAKWSVSLEARTAGAHHIGERHSHYINCPARGEGIRRAFRTDSTGCSTGSTTRSRSRERGAADTPATGLRGWRRRRQH